MILAVAYVADAFILATYLLLARTGRVRPYHVANVVGAVPIAVSEVVVGAWPVLVLTVFFGAIGALGLLKGK